MKRSEFLRRTTAIGIGLPFLPYLLSSCKEELLMPTNLDVNFNGKVLIIGAGSAGMVAGHVLNKYGVDFEILEASSRFGGRVKEIENFADFPIDLGAEWIHDEPSILATLISDENVNGNVELINYSPETIYLWKNGKLRKRNWVSNFYGEYKFKNTTWYHFLDQFIVPGINDRMIFNSPVASIDYSGDQIFVTTSTNEVYQADKLILTVPLTTLKQNLIEFNPGWPQNKIAALDDVDMPDGVKIFMEFSERFYPDLLFDGGLFENLNDENGAKTIYDAAFRKDSSKNVLALFSVGEPSSIYTNQPSDEATAQYFLDELDRIFDGQASKYHMKHVVQNWTNEPFIGGSYSHFRNYDTHDILKEPIDNKIFFAGEAYAEEATATVHGAGLSAYAAVERILQG